MKEKAILKGDSTANETENCKDFSNKSSFECSYFYLTVNQLPQIVCFDQMDYLKDL